MASWQYDLVLSSGITHLQNTNDSAKRAFLVRYEQVLFPESGSSVGQTVWKTWRNITRVTPWGRDHFRNNIRLAMVKEALGLGPRFYCILRTSHPGFSQRLLLLAQFLPHQKFYLYPHFGLPPRGPFNFSAHTREVSAAISQRILPTEERPNMCPACDSCFCDHVMEGLIDL